MIFFPHSYYMRNLNSVSQTYLLMLNVSTLSLFLENYSFQRIFALIFNRHINVRKQSTALEAEYRSGGYQKTEFRLVLQLFEKCQFTVQFFTAFHMGEIIRSFWKISRRE